MAEVRALLRGQDGPELVLALGRVLGAVGEAQLAADPDAVGVADHGARDAVEVPQQEVGGLPAHAGELQQRLHGVRYFSAVVRQKHLAGQDDVPGLVLVEAAGVDHVLHLSHVGPGEALQGREALEERRGDQVHPLVGALGRQPHRDHQLVVLLAVQSAEGLGVVLLQGFNDPEGLFFLFHIGSSCKQ